jgi:hypothetical protein
MQLAVMQHFVYVMSSLQTADDFPADVSFVADSVSENVLLAVDGVIAARGPNYPSYWPNFPRPWGKFGQ